MYGHRDGTKYARPELVGDRFKPLTYEQMTPEQKKLTDDILNSPRKSMGGPFNTLLRSPEMGDLTQQLGATAPVPFVGTAKAERDGDHHDGASLDVPLRVVRSQARRARQRIEPGHRDAIAEASGPRACKPDEEAVYTFCDELLNTKKVSDATFAAAVKALGEKGVVDLIGVSGYYGLVSMILNVDRHPLPDGARSRSWGYC